MNFNSFYYLLIVFTIILVFSLIFFIPIFSKYGYISTFESNSNYVFLEMSNSKFIWPTPGYTTITSNFGYRNAPTSGAGTYHGGVDIAVPAGSNIVAVFSGIVTYSGFKGANGFTIIVENGNFSFSYSHVSPNFIVTVGQHVKKGNIIAKVGPKNVYGVANNPYKDSNGIPTNRCYYRSSFAFFYKKRRQSRQSFKLFLITYLLHLHHYYNVNNHVRNNHHGLRILLPNLVQ